MVRGVVKDTTGQPIPYVVVSVKNSVYGVNTNLKGSYFLELRSGAYTLVFSQLGYEKQEHNIIITDTATLVLNIALQLTTKTLQAVEIIATGDRDKGREIMRKVIANRAMYWDRVENYQCITYRKSSLERIRIIKPGKDTIQETSNLIKEEQDSTIRKGRKKKKTQAEEQEELERAMRNKQLNLIEAYSQVWFRPSDTYSETVYAYNDFSEKQPNLYIGSGGGGTNIDYGENEIAPVQYYASNPYLLITDAPSADFNFYRNQISLPQLSPRPLLSPAASTALINYRFEFLNSFTENGRTIHKISVIPLFKQDALFSGLLFIEDSTWAIVSLNLSINPGALQFCKEFSVIQDYKQIDTGIYLPIRREFSYTIREKEFSFIGNTRVDHSNYIINTTIPPKTFTDEVRRYTDDAFDKDSLYWEEHRPIQLEEKEIRFVNEMDSIATYYESEAYLNKQDSIDNHLNIWSFVLNGVYHRNRAKGYNFYIDPLISQMIVFGVGGYRHRVGGSFNQELKNDMLLETDGQIDYGFLNRDVRGKVGVGLTYIPRRFVRTFVRFGDFYDMVNTFASLESVFSRSNYVRCREFSIAQRMEIVNGLFGELTFEYSDQFPITNLQLEEWSTELFGSLNTPLNFNRYVKAELRLELKYRHRQKYIIKRNKKIILGSKYPELRFIYRKGFPVFLGSEVNFDYVEFGSVDEMKFGRFGTSSWSILGGAFINKRNLRLLEHKYFRGSDSFLFSDPIRSFQLLGPTLETANTYFRLNYIHHFEGVFGAKIPLYNKLKITTAVGGGTLIIPSQNFNHVEFFAGLERVIRIRKQLFRLGVYGVTADNTLNNPTLTWKVGLSFFNSYTKRWSF